ncbi:PKD domain-containing protein [Candidatus Latescibacterota bacterium]
MKKLVTIIIAVIICAQSAAALENMDKDFKIFQFPRTMIPSIDGDTSDWDIVGDEYVYDTTLLHNTSREEVKYNPEDLDIKVRVGWVKGLNRLYFLYEAWDDCWDYMGDESDIFEIVVDADLSGGPFTVHTHPETDWMDKTKLYKTFHGVHAQNYHFNVPPGGKHWAFVWGGNDWISYFPYANWAYDYNVKHLESGRIVLEFYITCYDYAASDGPARAVESKLEESELIGLGWAVLEHDGNNKRDSHWTLAPIGNMTSNASYFCPFRLMPLEDKYIKTLEAAWRFSIIDESRRVVAFVDESVGKIDSWEWDFDDGTTSTEQHPIHTFERAGIYNVSLVVTGPAGKERHLKFEGLAVR